jgi:tRNA(Leu) C34 or U34 (ribose-2'-O)-methylase TrmL
LIGLTNPKSPGNVGSVMRAAGCFQADAVFYTGQRYPRAAKFHTDTQSISQQIPLTQVESLLDAVPEEVRIVCVEIVEGATALPEFDHPQHAFYIFGPEDGTIDQRVVDRADAVVYVPTMGCLNLAATVNVVLYDRIAKMGVEPMGDKPMGDALIRRSRDTNNRVRLSR